MDDSRYNLSAEEYDNLKNQLNQGELAEIAELEKDCDDADRCDYWDIYRKAFKFMTGKNWNPERLTKLRASPMHRLKMHLLHRAGQLRGIKFKE